MDARTSVSPAKRRAALAPLDANAMPVASPKLGVKDAVVKSVASPVKAAAAGTKRRADEEADADASPAVKKTCLERDEVCIPCPNPPRPLAPSNIPIASVACPRLVSLNRVAETGRAAAAALALAHARLGVRLRHLGRRRRRLVGDGRHGARPERFRRRRAASEGEHDARAGERGAFLPCHHVSFPPGHRLTTVLEGRNSASAPRPRELQGPDGTDGRAPGRPAAAAATRPAPHRPRAEPVGRPPATSGRCSCVLRRRRRYRHSTGSDTAACGARARTGPDEQRAAGRGGERAAESGEGPAGELSCAGAGGRGA